MSKKVLFITPYPHDEAPSQRFRFEQYFRFLKENDIEYVQKPFLSYKTWNILYKPGNKLQKIFGIIGGFLSRWLLMLTIGKYDFVFIHREASPIGPPIFEFIVAKIYGKPTNYDFDDAIWLPNTSEVNKIVSRIKWHSKVGKICKWVGSVTCGNEYLRKYAAQFNPNAIYLPTTIDTELVHNRTKSFDRKEKRIIGWTGTHSTIGYLYRLLPVIEELEKKYDFELRIISNKNPEIELKSFKYVPWNKKTEIDDLLTFDIGIMPLEDDMWAQGKCGFKILQYMALGIIPLASPVGVNKTIIEHGINGYLCENETDWINYLSHLLKNPDLPEMSKKARQTVLDGYSVLSQKDKFLQLLEK